MSPVQPLEDLKPITAVLALQRDRRAAVRDWLVGLGALSQADAALTLRVARLCAWFKRQDLVPIGYPTYTAFVLEEVDFADRWLRALIKLVESPLELIKEAASRGALPLRAAVLAPGHVAVHEQMDWLEEVAAGRLPEPEPPARVPVGPHQARDIQDARRLARLIRGRHETRASVDGWILERWRHNATAEELLDEAREVHEPPEHDPLAWCDHPDPATELVGPWSEPTDLYHALDLLQEVQALRRTSTRVVATAWDDAVHHRLWVDVGLPNADALAKAVLGTSARTMQRHRQLGRELGWHDVVRAELERGTLDLDRAEVAMAAAWLNPVEPWLQVARAVTRHELPRLARQAREVGARARRPYEVAASSIAEDEPAPPADPATDAAGADEPLDEPELLALPPADPPPPRRGPPAWMAVDPDLPEAARWLLDTVRIPPQRGFGVVKERDDYVCQNPLCGKRALRNHAHHLVPRSEGGSDDPSNGICQCPACHLRLIHTGIVYVTIEGDDLVWNYPRGKIVRVLNGATRLARSAA